eukprot:TRINITY_DN5215_c0_g1_i2.p1 TRINITY_DN5215_c0_g1~~TRINITY_DN5215_c0_g1_i2.p1  ORF type:complete len:306 (+),score=81.38 TRINITY_DN5215_c0_g1_i2:126-1043(+)
MTDVWNTREVRDYPGGFAGDAIGTMRSWISGQNFKIVKSDPNVIKAEKNGVHVNFMPELMLVFSTSPSGTQVALNYFAHIKVAKAAVIGILTGGLSTVVGAGTFTAHVADANRFVASLFLVLEGLAVRRPSIVVSRTDSAPITRQQSPQQPAYPSYSPYPPQQPGGPPQQAYPPYAPAAAPYPGSQSYGQQPAAPQQYQQLPQYPQQNASYPQLSSGWSSGEPDASAGTPNVQTEANQAAPYSQMAFTQATQQLPQTPVAPVPALIPTNPDFKTLSTEELDALLMYHKDTAWKIERQIMERRQRV